MEVEVEACIIEKLGLPCKEFQLHITLPRFRNHKPIIILTSTPTRLTLLSGVSEDSSLVSMATSSIVTIWSDGTSGGDTWLHYCYFQINSDNENNQILVVEIIL